MDKLTPGQRRKNMQAVKAKGSVIEVILAKAIWNKGYRYRKNDETVFGKPDLTFKKLRIAIFIDGEFWHGKDWKNRKHDHKSNQEFWHNKIEKNMNRDKIVNRTLRRSNWKVLRFWGKQVQKNLDSCIFKIESTVIFDFLCWSSFLLQSFRRRRNVNIPKRICFQSLKYFCK